ncbi:MAG: DUF4340 domain-containing protein [Gammaproteobacteria bacterium]|nr:MAG: DUF4340 domain-containing protein [Gammaproteobacteria bacterium]
MKRWIPLLSVLLAVQLGLALWLAQRGDPLAAARPDTPLVRADATRADRLVIADKDGEVEVRAKDGRWTLPGHFDAPVKKSRVEDLLKRLATVRLGYPVATSAEARKRFEVAEDAFARKVELYQGDKLLARLWLGTSSGVRRTYVRPDGEKAVYLVDLESWDFPARPTGWLDQDLVHKDLDGLQAIGLDYGLRLVAEKEKDATKWRAEGLKPGAKLKKGAAASLVNALEGLRVDGILGTQAKPEWGQDAPLRTLVLKAKGGESTWVFSKEKGEKEAYVLKTSGRPWYFHLETWNAKPVINAATPEALVAPSEDKTTAGTAKSGRDEDADTGEPKKIDRTKTVDKTAG